MAYSQMAMVQLISSDVSQKNHLGDTGKKFKTI